MNDNMKTNKFGLGKHLSDDKKKHENLITAIFIILYLIILGILIFITVNLLSEYFDIRNINTTSQDDNLLHYKLSLIIALLFITYMPFFILRSIFILVFSYLGIAKGNEQSGISYRNDYQSSWVKKHREK